MKTKDFSNNRSEDARRRPGRFVYSWVMAALLVLSSAAGTAQEFEYTNYNHEITITKYTGAGGDVVIPEKVDGSRVTSIGPSAFFNCTNLTGVTIPEGVVEIAYGAFETCRNLANLALPNTLTRLGSRAFFGCTSLTNITLPGSITQWPMIDWGWQDAFGSWVFADCTNLITVTMGEGMQLIPPYAFSGCINLKSILIPNSVTAVGNGAFLSCRNLAEVPIPGGVSSLGAFAFSGCTSLTNVTIPGSITQWPIVTNYGAFELLVGSWVFQDCTNLTTVTIGEGVLNVPAYGFSGCVRLTTVLLPNSATNIGSGAFMNCRSLTGVTLRNGVTRLGARAFAGCASLTSITIPGSVKNWAVITIERRYPFPPYTDASTFSGCTSLATVTIGDGVSNIPLYAFVGCRSLTNVYIGEGVASISLSAFDGCASLAAILVSPFNPAYTSLDGILYDKNRTSLLEFPQGRAGAYEIPASVTDIGDSAFSDCTGLTGVTIPSGVTRLGARAFVGCTGLTSISIPGSIRDWAEMTIDPDWPDFPPYPVASTFSGCCNLASVAISPGVTNIPVNAFSDCVRLATVLIPNSVTSIGDRAFLNCRSLCNLAIPANLTRLGARALAGCTSLTSITIPGSLRDWVAVTDVGFNPLGSAPSFTGSWTFAGCTNLATITIEEGVSNIPAGAFAGYGGSIWYTTSAGCSGLTGITIPASVTSLGTPPPPYSDNTVVPIFSGSSNLTGIYFQGNCPSLISDLIDEFSPSVTVYYLPGTTGWGATYGGCRTAAWTPQLQAVGSGIGGGTNGFEFSLSWARGKAVTVEACTNLFNPVWSPVQTLTLTNGSSYFMDAEATNYPMRFYRIRAL